MPNGDRVPYRVPNWRGPALASPIHSSDSEDTHDNKLRWRVLARWVLVRWREYVRRRKAQGSMSRSSRGQDQVGAHVHACAIHRRYDTEIRPRRASLPSSGGVLCEHSCHRPDCPYRCAEHPDLSRSRSMSRSSRSRSRSRSRSF